MTDSTPFIDDLGIRRDRPIMPKRHAIEPHHFDALAPIAIIGSPGSRERRGWIVLLQVHGYEAVLRAAAHCYRRAEAPIGNAVVQAVLDGKPEAMAHYRRRGRSAGAA